MDKAKVIASIFEKTGIKISLDDPAFYLVEINRFLLEDESKKIASDLSSTAMKFDVIATQNMDNFIHVANEALSKFMLRTNELKAVAEGLTLPQFIEVKKVSSEQNSNTLSTKDKTDGITLVMVFASGVLLGAILMGLKFLI